MLSIDHYKTNTNVQSIYCIIFGHHGLIMDQDVPYTYERQLSTKVTELTDRSNGAFIPEFLRISVNFVKQNDLKKKDFTKNKIGDHNPTTT